MQLVVMGVAGSGKSTVAALIARASGCALADGDAFHSPANIARMTAGSPLDDAHRAPWLAAIGSWLAGHAARGQCCVVSCSALRRAYRDVLRRTVPSLQVVHLSVPYPVAAQRLASRRDHFMPVELLASQYALLEPLGPDEQGITIDAVGTPEQVAARVLGLLRR